MSDPYKSYVEVANRKIGYGHPTFVVAEIGINHNGSLDTACQMISEAHAAGAEAVKFQKRTIDAVYTEEELARERKSPFGDTNRALKEGLEFGLEELDHVLALLDPAFVMGGLEVLADLHRTGHAEVGLDEGGFELFQQVRVELPSAQQTPQRIRELLPRP